MAKLTDEEERARVVLDTLAGLSHLSNQDIARRAGFKDYQAVQQRRTGEAKIGLPHLLRFAEAFEVPTEIFNYDLPTLFRWIADNPLWASRWARHAKGALVNSAKHAA